MDTSSYAGLDNYQPGLAGTVKSCLVLYPMLGTALAWLFAEFLVSEQLRNKTSPGLNRSTAKGWRARTVLAGLVAVH